MSKRLGGMIGCKDKKKSSWHLNGFPVVSHISAFWLPTRKNIVLHSGQSRSKSAEQGKKGKKKSLAAPPNCNYITNTAEVLVFHW